MLVNPIPLAGGMGFEWDIPTVWDISGIFLWYGIVVGYPSGK